MIEIFKKNDQADGGFNGGEILEKRPVGFPQDGGKLKPYSNLFYWAHAWSDIGSTIGLHPHQAFEIMTFILEGEIKHYDTKINKWINLKKGDVQIIRAGNGVSHAERLESGSQIFQIWFDPNIYESIKKPASYKDFKKELFKPEISNGASAITYVGPGSPVTMDSDVIIREIHLKKGGKVFDSQPEYIISIFIIEGEIQIRDNVLKAGDFIKTSEMEIPLTIIQDSRIFMVFNPVKLNYITYADKYL